MLTLHPIDIALRVNRNAKPRANTARKPNPGGLVTSLVLLGLAGVGAVVVWKRFADENAGLAQGPRPMTGRVGRFAWEMDREIDAVGNVGWYDYHWRIFDGNVLIANGDTYEKDDQLAYDKAKNQIDATIAKHMP